MSAPGPHSRRRRALLVATDTYGDPALTSLRAPVGDVRALATVLSDPVIGGFETRELINRPTDDVKEQIEGFFDEARLTDMLLLYVSGHGVLSQARRLYFATCTTKLARLRATGVEAGFVQDVVEGSRARSVVVMLDCCHSGAFPQGLVPKSAPTVVDMPAFEGRGRVTLTASTELESAFEEGPAGGDPDVREFGTGSGSLFTRYLVEGLSTGEADVNQDGNVSIDELYDYVFARLRERSGQQTPGKLGVGYGEIVLAKSPRGAALPPELRHVVEHSYPAVRLAAIQQMLDMRDSADAVLASAIALGFEKLCGDPDPGVAAAAAGALDRAPVPQPAPPPLPISEPEPGPEPEPEPEPEPAPQGRRCAACGREVAPDADFCECGEYLHWEESRLQREPIPRPSADMGTCPSCGSENSVDQDFCRICSEYLRWEEEPAIRGGRWADYDEALQLEAARDRDGARAAWQRALDSQDREVAGHAAGRLGLRLEDTGDAAGAAAAYRRAMESEDPQMAPWGASALARMLREQHDVKGARAAYQSAVDSDHTELAPKAAFALATMLEDEGDAAGAREAYRVAAASGHPEVGAAARAALGEA